MTKCMIDEEICKEMQGYTLNTGFNLPMNERTVYVHENDMKPFRLTRENVRELLDEILNANPHLKFSYENVDTFDKYYHTIDYYLDNSALDGYSYHKVAGAIISKLERDCIYSFGVPYNPYWQMSEEEVLEIENIMRSDDGLEPVEKMLR